MSQPVIAATEIMAQNSLYYKSTSGYKSYKLLWPLNTCPEMATISGFAPFTLRA